MIGGRRFLVAVIVLCALVVLSSSGRGQSTTDSAGASTIFPSLAPRVKQAAVVWSETDVRQSSPIQKTVFQQVNSGPVLMGSPAEADAIPQTVTTSQLSLGNGTGYCPECGR